MNNIEIIERMKNVAHVKEDQQLAELLGITKSAVANWKRGTQIPFTTAGYFCQKYDCDLHWLTFGESKGETLDTSEKMLLTAFNDLDDSQKMQAVVFVGNLAKNVTSVVGSGTNQNVSSSIVGDIAGRDINR